MVRLGFLFLLLLGNSAIAQVVIGPAQIQHQIYGQSVNVPFLATVSVSTVGNEIVLSVRLDGDLADLQSKFRNIVGAIPLPNNNCPSYGIHPLPTLEDASLRASGTSAVISVRARVVAWTCVRNPVPACTGFTGQQCVNLPFNQRWCTDVPQMRCEDGSPVKTILVQEGFWGELPLSLVSRDQVSLDVVPGRASLEPRGDVGRFFNNIAGLFNANLSRLAQTELDKLVDEGTLRAAIPAELRQYNLRIQSASFTSNGSTLGVRASMTASIRQDQLNDVLRQMLAAQAGR